MNGLSSQEQKKNGRGCHPNSIAAGTANLVPYKSGQSGNPGGRPKGTPSIGHAYAKLLALSPAERAVDSPGNGADEIALAQIKEAIDGEVRAAKEITDRTDGPVERRVVIENPAEFTSRLRQAWSFWTQLRANIHEKMCKGNACVCLSDEPTRQAILMAYSDTQQARVAAEAELVRFIEP